MGIVHGHGDYGNFRITSDCCPEDGIRNVEAVTNHSVYGLPHKRKKLTDVLAVGGSACSRISGI
jgi:hypothetical protein